jgi:phenylacetaldehyde dehydrogenase
MGPLVSSEQFDRVTGYIKSGRDQGARVTIGGDRVGNRGYFVAPTVFENARPDMKIITEEIWGPVVCAQPFDDRPNTCWCSNGFEIGCDNRQWVRIAYTLDCCDREAIKGWRRPGASTAATSAT